jgi:hypothetical protein
MGGRLTRARHAPAWRPSAATVERPGTGFAHDGGPWRGPTEADWVTRILHGALPPRESTGLGRYPGVAGR